MNLHCTECRQVLQPDDINVAKDVAFCRTCNRVFSLSKAVHSSTVPESNLAPEPEVDLNQPPSGMWYEPRPGGFELGATTRSCVAFFLVPFACVWSGGSLGGIYGSQILSGKFELILSLFGLPFLIGSVFLVSITLYTVFGKIVLSVEGGQGTIFNGVGPIGFRKHFDVARVQNIYEQVRRGKKNSSSTVIVIDGPERVEFGGELSDARRIFMRRVLQKLIPKR